MMPFAGDWVAEAAEKGNRSRRHRIKPSSRQDHPENAPPRSQEPAMPSMPRPIRRNRRTPPGNISVSIRAGRICLPFFENLATKGALNPVIIPRDDISVTDFYEFPEEYNQVLEAAKSVGRLEFYGKSDFGSYVDRAVQKILVDPNADPEKNSAQRRISVPARHCRLSMRQIRDNRQNRPTVQIHRTAKKCEDNSLHFLAFWHSYDIIVTYDAKTVTGKGRGDVWP